MCAVAPRQHHSEAALLRGEVAFSCQGCMPLLDIHSCMLCSMKLERVLWSSARASNASLTVFTTLTVDRLKQLRDQCRSYAGPLSAAVYLSVIQGTRDALVKSNVEKVQEAVAAVEAFHAE